MAQPRKFKKNSRRSHNRDSWSWLYIPAVVLVAISMIGPAVRGYRDWKESQRAARDFADFEQQQELRKAKFRRPILSDAEWRQAEAEHQHQLDARDAEARRQARAAEQQWEVELARQRHQQDQEMEQRQRGWDAETQQMENETKRWHDWAQQGAENAPPVRNRSFNFRGR